MSAVQLIAMGLYAARHPFVHPDDFKTGFEQASQATRQYYLRMAKRVIAEYIHGKDKSE